MSVSTKSSNSVEKAEEYYNSNDADEFYFKIWGGEHIHVGIYHYNNEPIKFASQRIVPKMASCLNLDVFKKVLDLGSGYGGGPRYLAKNFGCHVTCLNLSEVQNERNEQLNMERGLDHLIDVVYGSFEEIPFPDNSFDVIWSQDAMVHSANRDQVVAEAFRVLKPGGDFIFTDLMQDDNVPKGVLGPVLDRIHLDSLGSFKFYWEEARKNGFELMSINNMSQHLVTHYDRVRQETEKQYEEIIDACGKEYIDQMIQGLNHWVQAGNKGHLNWGIMHFKKA